MGAEAGPDRWALCVITAAGCRRAPTAAVGVAGVPEHGWAGPSELLAGVAGRWAGRG
jgi:hypothetical protein